MRQVEQQHAHAAAQIALADAHCHPQDDPDHLSLVSGLRAARVAVMGTQEGDWEAVEQLHLRHPAKVIPCFGVHPWYAHLHALSPGTTGGDLIEQPTGKQQGTPQERQGQQQQQQQGEREGALLASRPSCDWQQRLRGLLGRYPTALVGEFGLDRAAIIPGTKLRVSYSHQLALTELHLRLAAELRRPVSMHCVRAYGHLHEMLQRLAAEGACPPRIMLHSFGGSPEVVPQFTRGLQGGIGSRVYFSFSTVINGKNRDKLLARIRAVPDDRFLLESDQNTPREIDGALEAILQAVAEAKGWEQGRTARQAMSNFHAFFQDCG